MAFPHHIVVRVSWAVSAVAAVLLIAREFGDDGHDQAQMAHGVAVEARAFDQPLPDIGARDRADGAIARPESDHVILSLTMVSAGESRTEGFRLSAPVDVRVVAVGEGTGGEMYDYGVIVDATTRRPVWTMQLDDTHHAGGADKNRMVDAVLSLDAGNYLVHYVTDDSHSYGDWNSTQPDYPELWGITVLGAHGPPDPALVQPYNHRDDPSLLASILGVGDNEERRQGFRLDRGAEVRIYAIGEGDASDMYDYARIEDARTGRIVWRMTYDLTEHAGGAPKNRIFDGFVTLSAGPYDLVYESDGSHSSGSWNSAPPEDAFGWGVTVSRQ